MKTKPNTLSNSTIKHITAEIKDRPRMLQAILQQLDEASAQEFFSKFNNVLECARAFEQITKNDGQTIG